MKFGNAYEQEHFDLIEAIRNNEPRNEGWYGATSSFTAVLGRMATYSGQRVMWDEAVAKGTTDMPDTLAWDASPKVLPDEHGNYPIPMPGVYQGVLGTCTAFIRRIDAMHAPDETIVAIASPPGGGARGIVRLSGPDLRSCLEGCFRPDPPVHLPSLPRPTAVPGCLWLAGFASPLPCELYLWPGKRSYTGQPVAEVHTFGSPPLLEAVVRAVCSGGARPAEPGEFTLRAFLAGRIDLTQAEAVLGVIDATGAAELDAALAAACRRAGRSAAAAARRSLGTAGPLGGRARFCRRGPAVHHGRGTPAAT